VISISFVFHSSIYYLQGDDKNTQAYYLSTVKLNSNKIIVLDRILLVSSNIKARITIENNCGTNFTTIYRSSIGDLNAHLVIENSL